MLIIRDKNSGYILKPFGLIEDPIINNFRYKAIFDYAGRQWTNGVIWFIVESKNVKTVPMKIFESNEDDLIPLIVADDRYGIWPNPKSLSDEFYQFGPRIVAMIKGNPSNKPVFNFYIYRKYMIKQKSFYSQSLLRSFNLIPYFWNKPKNDSVNK